MKPRILFITPLPPPVHGAAVVSRQIMESQLIGDAFDCDFVNLSTSRNMKEIGKGSLLKIWRFLVAYAKTFRLLASHKYDLCYLAITCHGGSFLKDAPFVRLCKLFGKRIVIHQHNKGMSACVDRWPYRSMLPSVYRNVKVILLSWHLYPDIEKIVPRTNVCICPNGINPGAAHYVERNNGTPRILFLSNLIESKGVLVLLDALKILLEKGCPFICDFVGGQTSEIDAARFEQEVTKRGLENRVFFLGGKYGQEKDEIFDRSDIFAFPTFYGNECFPLVILEAMSHYLPVVTTDEGGIPDMVENGVNGFVCRRKDPSSLADSLQSLLSDSSLRHRMGQEGRRKLENAFTSEIFEKRMFDFLNSEISRKV